MSKQAKPTIFWSVGARGIESGSPIYGEGESAEEAREDLDHKLRQVVEGFATQAQVGSELRALLEASAV
jgi:hypothetical protein